MKKVVYDLEEKLLEYTTFISQPSRWPQGLARLRRAASLTKKETDACTSDLGRWKFRGFIS